MTNHSVRIRGVNCKQRPFGLIRATHVRSEHRPMIPSVMRDINPRQSDVFSVCVGNIHGESSVDRGRVIWMCCSKIESEGGAIVVSDFRGELLNTKAIHIELAFYPMEPLLQGLT